MSKSFTSRESWVLALISGWTALLLFLWRGNWWRSSFERRVLKWVHPESLGAYFPLPLVNSKA